MKNRVGKTGLSIRGRNELRGVSFGEEISLYDMFKIGY